MEWFKRKDFMTTTLHSTVVHRVAVKCKNVIKGGPYHNLGDNKEAFKYALTLTCSNLFN